MPRLVIASTDALRMTTVGAALGGLELDTMTVTVTPAQVGLLRHCLEDPFDVAVIDAALFEALFADAAQSEESSPESDSLHASTSEQRDDDAQEHESLRGAGAIVVLTDSGDVTQRLRAFAAGAEDCLEYPCHPQELCARVQVILRRRVHVPVVDVAVIVAGDLVLQPRALAARLGDRVLNLTSTEFNLLALLAREPGQVQSRDSLALRVLGRQLSPYDRSIDTHISHLRRKLSLKAHPQLALRSVRGNGYVLLLNAA